MFFISLFLTVKMKNANQAEASNSIEILTF